MSSFGQQEQLRIQETFYLQENLHLIAERTKYYYQLIAEANQRAAKERQLAAEDQSPTKDYHLSFFSIFRTNHFLYELLYLITDNFLLLLSTSSCN